MIDQAIIEFDKYLGNNELSFEGIIIGGAALVFLQITTRFTRDVDCLSPPIPEEIKKAATEFALEQKHLNLHEKWFNDEPKALSIELPDGWRDRLQPLYHGKNLRFQTLGRADFLKTKLYAYCDRTMPDLEDLLKLKPTIQELLNSIAWVQQRDTNPSWPEHVERQFLALKETLCE